MRDTASQAPFGKSEKKKKDLLTSSNTSFSLYWVNAEHSTYFTAPSSLAMRSPSTF